jgi:homeobox domain-containing protein
MRPPTRSTRSVRPPLNTNNARRSRNAPEDVASSRSSSQASNKPPKPKPQPIITTVTTTAAADTKVDPGTSPRSEPAPVSAPPVVGCFPVLPPSTFVYENQNQSQSYPESLTLVSPSPSVAGPIILGKPPRPRHRMSSNKLETLDAFFRRNTHPSRKEKEAICKDLDM